MEAVAALLDLRRDRLKYGRGSFEFRTDGRVFTFHNRCEQLWQEERFKLGRR